MRLKMSREPRRSPTQAAVCTAFRRVAGNGKSTTDQVGHFGSCMVEVRHIRGVGRSHAVNLDVEVVVPVVGRADQAWTFKGVFVVVGG